MPWMSKENAKEFIEASASHVIVTSYLFENGKLCEDKMIRLKDAVSKEKIVFDLSCKKVGDKYFVTTDRWQTITDTEMNADLLKELEEYCNDSQVTARLFVSTIGSALDIFGGKLSFDTVSKYN